MSRISDTAETMYYVATCLRHLDAIMALPQCCDCKKYRECEYRPEWGKPTRYNCPLFEKDGDE